VNTAARPDSLQEQTYGWLASRYPDGPQWNLEGFHCFKECHPLIRSLLAMDAVEGEISNGAWGQLLWNTFPIPILFAKLSEYEKGCRAAMQRAASGNFEKEFGGFTSIGYSDSKFEAQLAFVDPSLQALRTPWLEQNREAILTAIAA
jgi:hypothetical protein